jgi:hypothetical protein
MPIEIAVTPRGAATQLLEIAVANTVVRFEAGTDVAYVASVVRALREGS